MRSEFPGRARCGRAGERAVLAATFEARILLPTAAAAATSSR